MEVGDKVELKGEKIHTELTPHSLMSHLKPAISTNRNGKNLWIGIIRYMGPIQGKQGEYFGIELVEGKGRNDGTVMGERYGPYLITD